jgi:hypothetical protein
MRPMHARQPKWRNDLGFKRGGARLRDRALLRSSRAQNSLIQVTLRTSAVLRLPVLVRSVVGVGKAKSIDYSGEFRSGGDLMSGLLVRQPDLCRTQGRYLIIDALFNRLDRLGTGHG